MTGNGDVLAIIYLSVEWAIRLMMIVVVPFRRSAEASRSWLLLVFFLPIPALIIYLLIGRPTYPAWRRRRFGRLNAVLSAASKEIRHSQYCRRPELPANLAGPAALIEKLSHFPALSGNEIEFVSDYGAVIDRLIADIDVSRETVHLMFYIFVDDETGRRVIDALDRAARRGIKCRVLIDALGSRRWARSVSTQLAAAGVQVQLALRVGIFRRGSARADLRNHRKIAVVDGRIGYVGSQNITNAEFRSGLINEELVARVVGPVIVELQAVFVADWYMETGEKLDAPALFPHNAPGAKVTAQVLASGPDYPDAGIGHLMVALVHGANKRIVLTTPYFVPDEALLQALKIAALRGIEVHLVVSSRVDQFLVSLAQRSYYAEILAAGIKIHLYEGRFLHAKHVTFDGDIALIGSSNLDIRSFVLNAEISLVAYAPEVLDELRRVQARYFATSTDLALESWEKRSVFRKIGENIARLASPLL